MEMDKAAFDPEHMEEHHNNGGSFPMVNILLRLIGFLKPCRDLLILLIFLEIFIFHSSLSLSVAGSEDTF